MTPSYFPRGQGRLRIVLLACGAAALLAATSTDGSAQPAKSNVLRVGASGPLGDLTGGKEKSAFDMLQNFIKTETGFDSTIERQKDWRELMDKMARGPLQIGVFPGYEFAWAREKSPALKPLALTVNVYRYPTAHVVARRDSPAKDFAGLRGQTLSMTTGGGYVRLFVDRQSQKLGQPVEKFFAKILTPDNAEDALDDLVDGQVQAVAVPRPSLEAYKRRKPARFKQLKEVVHSQPFPPTMIAYQEGRLDEETLQRFRDGLVRANKSDRGQTLLTMFKITGFEAPPPDLDQVLARTRQEYPPPGE